MLSRGLQRRHNAEENSSYEAQAERKEEDLKIDVGFSQPRQGARTERSQSRHQRGGQSDSDDASDKGKQKTFAEQLAHQAGAGRAQSLADGNFSFPRGSSCQ